jgi:hypothetical protein
VKYQFVRSLLVFAVALCVIVFGVLSFVYAGDDVRFRRIGGMMVIFGILLAVTALTVRASRDPLP